MVSPQSAAADCESGDITGACMALDAADVLDRSMDKVRLSWQSVITTGRRQLRNVALVSEVSNPRVGRRTVAPADLLAEYVAHLGIPGRHAPADIPCELCGSTSATVVRERVDFGGGVRGMLPVVACDDCGFLFQNLRFPREFHDLYDAIHSRPVSSDSTESEEGDIAAQIEHGELLFGALRRFLPSTGNLLAVGCSAVGMMVPFAKHGWRVLGIDKDHGRARYGRDVLGLTVEVGSVEHIDLPADHYDLVMVGGSIECAYDPNEVLARCRRAAKMSSVLLLKSFGLAQARREASLCHERRRYLTPVSAALLMLKHGWTPIRTAVKGGKGALKPDGLYALGRAGDQMPMSELRRVIASGRQEKPADLRRQLDAWGIQD
jgi:hypothetical protein